MVRGSTRTESTRRPRGGRIWVAAFLAACMLAMAGLVVRSLTPERERRHQAEPVADRVEKAAVPQPLDAIAGRVLSAEGEPIPGARVLALKQLSTLGASLTETLAALVDIESLTGKAGVAAESVSGTDGAYLLRGLESTEYTVRVAARGFSPADVEDIPVPQSSMDLVLDRGAAVRGQVRDSAGAPVAGAVVRAYIDAETLDVFAQILARARPPVDEVQTDGNGDFELDTRCDGNYSLAVEAVGFAAAERLRQDVRPEGSAGIVFTLQPAQTIAGVVRGPDGGPVRGAKVRAARTLQSGKPYWREQVCIRFDDDSLLTDGEGRFAFEALEAGSYQLLCWHPGYQSLRVPGIRAGAAPNLLQLELKRGGRLRGRVVDAVTKGPIAGALVTASDVEDWRKDASTGEDGTYILAGLGGAGPLKPVAVSAITPGFARTRRNVTLEEGREGELDFALERTGSVSGQVVDSEGAPVSGALVLAKRTTKQSNNVEQTLGQAVTDGNGRFQLVEVEAGSDTRVRVQLREYFDSESDAFTLESGASIELPPLGLKLGASVSGKVVALDGKPIRGAIVTAVRAGEAKPDRSDAPQCATRSRGEFVIHGLASGTIDLVVAAKHCLEQRVSGVVVVVGAQREGIVVKLEGSR